jgi:hypothetical protein
MGSSAAKGSDIQAVVFHDGICLADISVKISVPVYYIQKLSD